MEKDYFTLLDFRLNGIQYQYALSKSYTVKGFMGQTTDAFDAPLIKSNVLVMGTCELNGKHTLHSWSKGEGMFTFYGGHDPEDFQHQVGDPPTVLDLHSNSPGYRLILNNILFPPHNEERKVKT
jgi:hypothetical protein